MAILRISSAWFGVALLLQRVLSNALISFDARHHRTGAPAVCSARVCYELFGSQLDFVIKTAN
jgi:hypothetical protein